MNSQILEIKQENHKVAMVLGSAFCRSVNQSLTQVIRKCTNAEDRTSKSIQGLKNKLRDSFQMPVSGKKLLVNIQSPQEASFPNFINSTVITQEISASAGSPNMSWIYWDMDSPTSQSHILTRYVDDCINQSSKELPVGVIVKANSSESPNTKDQLLILERHINGSLPILFVDENQMKFINLKPNAVGWKKNLIEKLILATLSYATLEKLLVEIHSQVSSESNLSLEIKAIRQLFSKVFND